MSNDASVVDLLARVRAGDHSAEVQIVDEYARRLVALARKKLDRRILCKEDPQDVVQSALKSFFRRHGEGLFILGSRQALWAILVRITLHKCGQRAEYYFAAKRDIRKEVDGPLSQESSVFELEALARDPSPDEVAILAEMVEQLILGLKPHQQKIVKLRLEGVATAHIATRVHLSQKSVQRVLNGVCEDLERSIAMGKENG